MRWGLALVAVGGLAVLLAGCSSMGGVRGELRQMRSQLNEVSKEVGAMQQQLTQAAQDTHEAQQNASATRSTAEQALAMARSDQRQLARLNIEIDRLTLRAHGPAHHYHHHHHVAHAAAKSSSSASASPASKKG